MEDERLWFGKREREKKREREEKAAMVHT